VIAKSLGMKNDKVKNVPGETELTNVEFAVVMEIVMVEIANVTQKTPILQKMSWLVIRRKTLKLVLAEECVGVVFANVIRKVSTSVSMDSFANVTTLAVTVQKERYARDLNMVHVTVVFVNVTLIGLGQRVNVGTQMILVSIPSLARFVPGVVNAIVASVVVSSQKTDTTLENTAKSAQLAKLNAKLTKSACSAKCLKPEY